MSLGKLKQLIFKNKQESDNKYPLLGFAVTFTGNGTSAPTVDSSYNVSAVNRTGTGFYQIILEQETILGNSVIDGFIMNRVGINPVAADTNYKLQLFKFNPVTIQIAVDKITSTTFNSYDLTSVDTLEFASFIYNGKQLPPE